MRDKTGSRLRFGIWGIATACLLVFCAAVAVPTLARADDARDAQQLVEKAKLSLEAFLADPDMSGGLRSLVRRGTAVLIYPQVLRGAFIIGVSGGSGVLLARDEKANTWGGPAFYTIGEASFGLQAGGDAAEIVLVALTERGIAALQSSSVKLGTGFAIAVGPVGAGAEAATVGLSADIISYTRTKGLYAGLSLNGAVVATRGGLNHAYYGKEVSPTEILIRRTVTNPQAAPLIEVVAKVASGK
jgi:lipid-binding SYLF domain-containing protein